MLKGNVPSEHSIPIVILAVSRYIRSWQMGFKTESGYEEGLTWGAIIVRNPRRNSPFETNHFDSANLTIPTCSNDREA